MTEETIDLIQVEAKHEAEIEADEAELSVTVAGSSLVMGNSVFEKAKEVARLVEALRRHGLSDDDFEMRDIHAEVSSGLLGKSSSAIYQLAIHVKQLDKLPDVLGEIGEAKQATLGTITWHFPDTAQKRAVWLGKCVADANVKAKAIADALPAKLVGVHRVVESGSHEGVYAVAQSYGGAPGSIQRARSANVGFQLGQRQKITVRITASYRVAAT